MLQNLNSLKDQAGDYLQSAKGQAGEYLQSEDFKKLLPYLISGGGAAVLGGAMSGRRKEEKGEGRMGYLGRILRNALVTGGLGAGAHYLVNQGLDKTMGGIADDAEAASADNPKIGPLETGARNIAFSPLTAAGAGLTGLGMTRGREGMLGANDAASKDALKFIAKSKDKSQEWLRRATAGEIGGLGEIDERRRRLAGLPSDRVNYSDKWYKGGIGNLLHHAGLSKSKAEATKGFLSTVGRKHLETLGQTPLRRAGRGAVGLAAAGIPALIGSLLTSEEQT